MVLGQKVCSLRLVISQTMILCTKKLPFSRNATIDHPQMNPESLNGIQKTQILV
jgi:hypothetical protein